MVGRQKNKPSIKTPAEIEEMKHAGHLSALALKAVGKLIEPGVSTLELDAFVENFIRSEGGAPTFKGYGGFPGSICASINDKVVHGIPNADEILHEGDIISIDTGATVDGWVGDNAYTYQVGEVSPTARLLCETTEAALEAGIACAIAGNCLGDVGHAIEQVALAQGFGVVREFVGHGIGRNMHEPPDVPNYGRPGKGMRLEPGMTIAIEPMVCEGTHHVHVIDDGWGVLTNDGGYAAHFERTIAITEDGPLVLTDW